MMGYSEAMPGRPVEPTFASVHQRVLSSSPRTAECYILKPSGESALVLAAKITTTV
jgi:hypothetical protein